MTDEQAAVGLSAKLSERERVPWNQENFDRLMLMAFDDDGDWDLSDNDKIALIWATDRLTKEQTR